MIVLYHAPQSRSSRIVWLLEELGAAYEIRYTNISRMDGTGGYDSANPHPDKKVPALEDDGVLITESIAIVTYLGDKFPQSGIAPQMGDKRRGPYLSWLAYYAGVIEPLVHFQFLKIDNDPMLTRTFRGRAEMDARLLHAVRAAPYLLGAEFTAADLILASLGQWMRNMLPADPAMDAYLERCNARPALQRAWAKDAPPA